MAPKKYYHNPDNVKLTVSWRDMLRWHKERRQKTKDLSYVIPRMQNINTEILKTNRRETSITWIGHATFLIQIAGLNIITDPVWANKMGFAKRLAAPGLALTDLPEIDVVLISHNHYDHLDFRSLYKLNGNPLHLVPSGLRSKFLRRGLARVEEFHWWDCRQTGQVEFTFVPAQHWSKRTPWDTNQSLWGGWIIRAMGEISPEGQAEAQWNKLRPTGSIYFVGDSGYFRGFTKLGQQFSITQVLMPIGAYEPEWFMHVQHLTPEQAVQAYLDLRADYFIPMHYEAFHLGDDTPIEALARLQAAWTLQEIAPSKLKQLKLGETLWTER